MLRAIIIINFAILFLGIYFFENVAYARTTDVARTAKPAHTSDAKAKAVTQPRQPLTYEKKGTAASLIIPNWNDYFKSLQEHAKNMNRDALKKEVLTLSKISEALNIKWASLAGKKNVKKLRQELEATERPFLLLYFSLKKLQQELKETHDCKKLYHNVRYFGSGATETVSKTTQVTLDIAKSICSIKEI